MNLINRISSGIISAMCFLPASAQDSGSAQLAELEKEKSYQMIREYIDYALENKDVRIPVTKNFKNYLKTEREKETNVSLYKGKEGVSPKEDLNQAWAHANLLVYQLEKRYLEIPEAAELEKEYRAKNIGREEYQKQRKKITEDLMYKEMGMRENVIAYQQAFTDACRESLIIILVDYERQDIAIPTDWIPESLQKRFEKSKRVKDVQKKIDALNK